MTFSKSMSVSLTNRRRNIKEITASENFDEAFDSYLCDPTAGTITVSLPVITTVGANWSCDFIQIAAANSVIIDLAGAETFTTDGAGTVTSTALGDVIRVSCHAHGPDLSAQYWTYETFSLLAAVDPYDDWLNSVLTRGTATPPGLPSDGDAYLIPTGAGGWTGKDDQRAEWSDAVADWVYATPTEGTHIVVEDEGISGEGLELYYTGVSWKEWENTFQAFDDVYALFGTAAGGDASLGWNTTQTQDALFVGLDATSKTLILAAKANAGKSFDRAAYSDPTLVFQDNTDPDSDNRLYGYMQHDGDRFIQACGMGYNYFPLDALSGNGQLTCSGNFQDGDKFTIGAVQYTAKAAAPGANEFLIGATKEDSIDAAVIIINAGAVVTTHRYGAILVIEHDTPGVAGNIVLTEDVDGGANFSVSGAGTLTGGRDAVTGTPGHGPNYYFPGISEFDQEMHLDGKLISTTSFTATGKVVEVTPSAALAAGASWSALNIDGAALGPLTGAATTIEGLVADFSAVVSIDGDDAICHGTNIKLPTGDTATSSAHQHELTEMTVAGIHTGYMSAGGSLALSATATYRGYWADLDSITRDAGAPILEGLRIELPADYTNFGTSFGGYFSGDGRSVTLCDTTYSLDAVGDARFQNSVIIGDVGATDTLTLSQDGTDANIAIGAGLSEINMPQTRFGGEVNLSGVNYTKWGNGKVSFRWNMAQTINNFVVALDSTNMGCIVSTVANTAKDHNAPAVTDPTLFIYSHNDPTVSTHEYLKLSNDGTDAELAIGAGLTSTKVPLLQHGGLYNKASSEDVADDGSIDLPDATTGWGFAQIGDDTERMRFSWTTAGVVTKIYGSLNAVTTDTDTKFCIFDNGTAVRIRNRLGSQQKVRYQIYYS